MLKEFRFILGHVHTGRTFRFAAFTGKAKIHDDPDLLMVEGILFGGAGKEFPEGVSPGPGRRIFVPGGHKARAHDTAYPFRLPAITRTIALFHRP